MAFATTSDVAERLGRSLSAGETTAADALIEAAQAVIAEACGKDDDWATSLSPVPVLLKAVCVDVVLRTLANPQGVASLQEQLGAHSSNVRFRDVGLTLTDREERLVRGAVYGHNIGSAPLGSIIDDVIPAS